MRVMNVQSNQVIHKYLHNTVVKQTVNQLLVARDEMIHVIPSKSAFECFRMLILLRKFLYLTLQMIEIQKNVAVFIIYGFRVFLYYGATKTNRNNNLS
jgi:hypothetical protein